MEEILVTLGKEETVADVLEQDAAEQEGLRGGRPLLAPRGTGAIQRRLDHGPGEQSPASRPAPLDRWLRLVLDAPLDLAGALLGMEPHDQVEGHVDPR